MTMITILMIVLKIMIIALMTLMMMTLKASVARNAAGKGIGPKKDLAAIGIITESTTKNNAFSCITWTSLKSDNWLIPRFSHLDI